MALPPPTLPHPEDEETRHPAFDRASDAGSQTRRSRNIDLMAVLARIDQNDAARWMLVKDKLDHGPFSGRELVACIEKGEARREHALINLDTGERRPLAEMEDFAPFLQQRERQERRDAERQVLNQTEKRETRSNVAKLIILALVLGGLATVAIGFLVSRKAARERRHAYAELAALYERGDVRIVGTVEMLPLPSAGSKVRSPGRASGGSKGSSYEAAMNRPIDLGDVSREGAETQLSGAVVASTLNQHVGELAGCVGAELRGGGAIGNVQLDLAIAGSGQVLGASVRQGSEAFRRCVQGKVLRVRFAKFGAARMGARYSFQLQ